MNLNTTLLPKAIAFVTIAISATSAFAQSKMEAGRAARPVGTRGVAVAYPWAFEKGNVTSKDFAISTAQEIGERAGYSMVSAQMAKASWAGNGIAMPKNGRMPSKDSVLALGKAVNAKKVLYGKVKWHTRSIWVNAGPKTISTATVDVYVMDVASGRVEYSKRGVQGRSDEKSNGYKIAAAVLFTPLVTGVSGGPSTPREQRAAQIALSIAFQPWLKVGSKATR